MVCAWGTYVAAFAFLPIAATQPEVDVCTGLKGSYKDSACCGGKATLQSVCMSKEISPNAVDPPVPGVMQGVSKPHVVLAMAPDYPPYTTWTNTVPTGLGGFNIEFGDLMLPICGVKVDFLLSSWEDCWTAKPERIYFSQVTEYVGKGIYEGHVHGCTAYTHTKGDRELSLEFSDSLLGSLKTAGILTRIVDGKPVVSPQLVDYTGVKLGDVSGWAPTADTFKLTANRCVSGSPTFIKTDKIIQTSPDGNEAAITALQSGEIDALFMYADGIAGLLADSSAGYTPTGFGTNIAYIHVGLSGWSHNGTTLSISKRGSGLGDVLNPCIKKVSQTQEYTTLCEKYFDAGDCIQNQFSSSAATTQPTSSMPMNARTDSNTCADGYCTCTEV